MLKGKIFTVSITSTDTIQDVKQKICATTGIPTDEQLLAFNGTRLKNRECVSEYR